MLKYIPLEDVHSMINSKSLHVGVCPRWGLNPVVIYCREETGFLRHRDCLFFAGYLEENNETVIGPNVTRLCSKNTYLPHAIAVSDPIRVKYAFKLLEKANHHKNRDNTVPDHIFDPLIDGVFSIAGIGESEYRKLVEYCQNRELETSLPETTEDVHTNEPASVPVSAAA